MYKEEIDWVVNATRRGREVLIGSWRGAPNQISKMLSERLEKGTDWQLTALPASGEDMGIQAIVARKGDFIFGGVH